MLDSYPQHIVYFFVEKFLKLQSLRGAGVLQVVVPYEMVNLFFGQINFNGVVVDRDCEQIKDDLISLVLNFHALNSHDEDEGDQLRQAGYF